MEKMNQAERLDYLIERLLSESGCSPSTFALDTLEQKRMAYRTLVNLRPPEPIGLNYLNVQDEYLQHDSGERGIVPVESLPSAPLDSRLALWQGDICRLRIDAIVNAANNRLLGCFHPCHGCIDNAIHTAAGLQLRQACEDLMAAQGHLEATGSAKITTGFNLPARHVLHTVGPIIDGLVTDQDGKALASCYASCLHLASLHKLNAVAFCCISTGEYMFPRERAASIAVQTVRGYLDNHAAAPERVMFNVFTDEDRTIYEKLLGIA